LIVDNLLNSFGQSEKEWPITIIEINIEVLYA